MGVLLPSREMAAGPRTVVSTTEHLRPRWLGIITKQPQGQAGAKCGLCSAPRDGLDYPSIISEPGPEQLGRMQKETSMLGLLAPEMNSQFCFGKLYVFTT